MCYQNLPSYQIVECQMDFMPLFCGLSNKAAHPCERHFFAPMRLRVFAVNELRFLG